MVTEPLDKSPECYNIRNFTILDITECGRALRRMGDGAGCMEEAARSVVRYLYDTLADGEGGDGVCSLVRFFKTHNFGELNAELKESVAAAMGAGIAGPGMKCLTLLASAGEESQWNSINNSKDHKVFPLPGKEALERIPMILHLAGQLGLPCGMLVDPDPQLILDMEQRTFNVFYVPEALGSPYIPAQEQFVIPYGIRSVIGFGGLLPSGNFFVVVMFLKIPLKRKIADLFRTLSLNVKVAILPFEENVFEKTKEGDRL